MDTNYNSMNSFDEPAAHDVTLMSLESGRIITVDEAWADRLLSSHGYEWVVVEEDEIGD